MRKFIFMMTFVATTILLGAAECAEKTNFTLTINGEIENQISTKSTSGNGCSASATGSSDLNEKINLSITLTGVKEKNVYKVSGIGLGLNFKSSGKPVNYSRKLKKSVKLKVRGNSVSGAKPLSKIITAAVKSKTKGIFSPYLSAEKLEALINGLFLEKVRPEKFAPSLNVASIEAGETKIEVTSIKTGATEIEKKTKTTELIGDNKKSKGSIAISTMESEKTINLKFQNLHTVPGGVGNAGGGLYLGAETEYRHSYNYRCCLIMN